MPQAHLPNDGELALAVDRVYRHSAITRAHLVAEIHSWGMRDADQIVDESLAAVLETVSVETPDPRAHPDLVDDIVRFATNLRAGREAGHH